MTKSINRRSFLSTSTAAAGGLMVGFHVPLLAGKALAQKAPEAIAPEINAWVVVKPDDTVVIRIARSEMGQGTLTGLAHMGRLVQENLKLIIDAIGESDAEKAMLVWRSDAAIDDIYNALFRELITYMMEDPRNITPCTHLLFIAKNLERVDDHATNIAELVFYAVTGQPLTDARPKGDNSASAIVRPAAGQ